jgi:hypothetical protein
MKIKNPKKVEAGRKAAMARAKKLDELKRLAAANQQRVHTEIAKDSPPGGGEDAAYEEPAPSQPSRRATRQWNTQTEWWVGGGALLLFVGYIMYIKKSEKKSSPSVPAPGVPPPVAPPPTAKVPAASSATAAPQPERQRQMYVPHMN